MKILSIEKKRKKIKSKEQYLKENEDMRGEKNDETLIMESLRFIYAKAKVKLGNRVNETGHVSSRACVYATLVSVEARCVTYMGV